MKKIRRKYLFLTDKKALKGLLRGRAILSHNKIIFGKVLRISKMVKTD